MLGVGTSVGQAQTVLNPSFESPATTNGSFAAGSGDNWTPTYPPAIPYGVYVFTNGSNIGTTPYGNQWVYFDGGTSDSQTISSGFVLGTVYTFSLDCADVTGRTNQRLTLTVSGGGMVAAATQTFAVPARVTPESGALPFATYSLAFTPLTAAPVTISFSNQTDASPLAADNVRLSAAGVGAVPEPSIWAPLGLGAVGWGWVVLRRRGA